jgi:Outer membrane protein beta-barrel domain
MLVLIAAWTPRSAFAHEHVRNGWCVGLGFGNGWANVSWDDYQRQAQWSGMVAARVGYAVHQSLVVSADFQGWAKDYDLATVQGDVPVNVKLSGATLGVVAFPGNVGFLVKGGLGVAVASVEVTPPSYVDFPTSGTFTDTGIAAMAGMGYEFRLTRTFALGIEFDAMYLGVEGEGISNVFNYGSDVTFGWYW